MGEEEAARVREERNGPALEKEEGDVEAVGEGERESLVKWERGEGKGRGYGGVDMREGGEY